VALFAADALAERLGAARRKRALLAAASAVALWSVSVRWGHPEDAVAVGLLLFAILALARAQPGRSAWLTGAAIAIQPLVLIALPVVAMTIRPGRLPGFLARAAAPAALLLGAAAWANWGATFHAVTSQPNWPVLDHPTPWALLAPHLGHGAVAPGPRGSWPSSLPAGAPWPRARWRASRQAPESGRLTGEWSAESLRELLWWVAVALALRSLFEPVIVAYYVWPVLAVALITASTRWSRLIATSVVATAVTLAAQLSWRGPGAGGVRWSRGWP